MKTLWSERIWLVHLHQQKKLSAVSFGFTQTPELVLLSHCVQNAGSALCLQTHSLLYKHIYPAFTAYTSRCFFSARMWQTQPFLHFTPNMVRIQRVDVAKQHVNKYWPPTLSINWCVLLYCITSSAVHTVGTLFNGISKNVTMRNFYILLKSIFAVNWFQFLLDPVKIVCVNKKYNNPFSGKLFEWVIFPWTFTLQ